MALGPKAQALPKPFLDRPADAFLFSPEEAYRRRVDHRAAQPERERTTPIYPSEVRAREKAKLARRARRAKRGKGPCCTAHSYWKALCCAFAKAARAGVELVRWSPHQLRHSRATELRKKHGIEATRVSLGHARLDATEIYAEKDLQLAIEVARQAG